MPLIQQIYKRMFHQKKKFTERVVYTGCTDEIFHQTARRNSPTCIEGPLSIGRITVAKRLFVIALLLFSLSGTQRVYSQDIRFDPLSIADGLSSNTVYSIYQDRSGMLWFGTLDGLNRYDGYTIQVFRHDRTTEFSLPNNRITLIYEDRKHQLWLYDEFTSSIVRYIPAKGEFKLYPLNEIANIDIEVVNSIREEADSNLYIHTRRGFSLRYVANKDLFERVSGTFAQPDKDFILLLQSLEAYLKSTQHAHSVKTIGVRKIFQDSYGRYWIATQFGGLFTAISSGGGFEFTAHLNDPNPDKRIESDEIYDVFEDKSNVIWVGTKNNGLFRYSHYRYKFRRISSVQTAEGMLPIGTVRALTQDNNKTLWVGTNNHGLIRIDSNKTTGKQFLPNPRQPFSIGHRFIRSLSIDNNQTLWVGHYNGFSRYLPDRDNFKPYTPTIENEGEIRVYDIKSDNHNDLWMAAWDVVLHFNQTTQQYESISRKTHADFDIENIRDLELNSKGNLLVAVSEKGMCLYDSVKKQFNTLRYSPNNPSGLPSDNIFDVFRDRRNNLWLATADGLCQFNPSTLACETYTTNEGLPSNMIFGLMEDEQGMLWFSSTKGIGRLDPINKTIRNYDISDGLPSNEFAENAFSLARDGTMYFGGINGLTYFHPKEVPDSSVPPELVITSLKVFDRPLAETKAFSLEKIEPFVRGQREINLTAGQRSFSLEFAALHYVNPQKNKYAYRLEGFDNSWTYRDANVRFANYTNLEPRTYTFQVKACNSDGVWSKPISLTIIIEKPFYSTWWFRSFIIVLLVAGGISAYRWRIQTVKQQQSMKSIQLESELNFLKSQVNPHFLFNTLNNIYALCQINSRNAAPMVGKVSEMMRYMIYDCAADLVLLQKEIEYLNNYIDLNHLKSNKKLNATISVEGNTNGFKIAPLLLINFLENSFKHGDLGQNGNGFIQVSLQIVDRELNFNIKSSYREKTVEHASSKGIGLKNVRHRLELLYPDRHSLKIDRNNGIFEVELKLELD